MEDWFVRVCSCMITRSSVFLHWTCPIHIMNAELRLEVHSVWYQLHRVRHFSSEIQQEGAFKVTKPCWEVWRATFCFFISWECGRREAIRTRGQATNDTREFLQWMNVRRRSILPSGLQVEREHRFHLKQRAGRESLEFWHAEGSTGRLRGHCRGCTFPQSGGTRQINPGKSPGPVLYSTFSKLLWATRLFCSDLKAFSGG